jgi:hypothetical protein
MDNGQLIIIGIPCRTNVVARASVFFTFAFLLFTSNSLAQLVKSVAAIGMTVADMDRSIDFRRSAL